MQAFTLGVVNAITALLAICDLGRRSPVMKKHNIPASGDQATIQDVLDSDFPTWKEYIKKQAERKLNKLKIQQAAQKATQGILPIVKKPIVEGIKAQVKDKIQPGIVANAKDAGKSAAKKIFDDRRAHIIEISLIPFYGWVKGPLLIKDASDDAKAAAKTAAQNSVKRAFNSTHTKEQMDQIKKTVARKVFADHKEEIHEKVQEALHGILEK